MPRRLAPGSALPSQGNFGSRIRLIVRNFTPRAGPVMLDSIAKLRPPAPVPRAAPLGTLGLLRVLARNPLEAWTEAHFSEPIVFGGLPFGRVAVVSDPAAIRRVLTDNAKNYEKDWLQRRVLSAGLTNGLLAAEREQWRTQRRIIAPLFARRAVMSYAGAMMSAARDLAERLDGRAGKPVDISVEVTRVTLDVLTRTIFSDGFGADPEDIRRGMRSYFERIGRIDPIDLLGLSRILPNLARSKAQVEQRFFETAIARIVARRREQLSRGAHGETNDLLTRLLTARDPDTGEGLSEQEVAANILTFIAAGHETTANCISWSLFLLSQSDAWLARVRSEAERELGGDIHTLADRLIETRAVIDETNRLYPPIAAISRSALGPDRLAGESITKGTVVVISPYVLHRHRRLWTDPDWFDPTRFLIGTPVDRFAYMPFGAGARTCIGATFALQEATIVVATLARYFNLEPAPGETVSPTLKVTLRPRAGMRMIACRWQTSHSGGPRRGRTFADNQP